MAPRVPMEAVSKVHAWMKHFSPIECRDPLSQQLSHSWLTFRALPLEQLLYDPPAQAAVQAAHCNDHLFWPRLRGMPGTFRAEPGQSLQDPSSAHTES